MLVDLRGVNRGKWNPIIHTWNENQVFREGRQAQWKKKKMVWWLLMELTRTPFSGDGWNVQGINHMNSWSFNLFHHPSFVRWSCQNKIKKKERKQIIFLWRLMPKITSRMIGCWNFITLYFWPPPHPSYSCFGSHSCEPPSFDCAIGPYLQGKAYLYFPTLCKQFWLGNSGENRKDYEFMIEAFRVSWNLGKVSFIFKEVHSPLRTK